MKNQIQLLAIALMAAGTVSANTANSSLENNSAVDSSLTKTVKYVSFANAELISSEIGDLKKAAPSINDAISADAQITDAIRVTYFPAVKKKAAKKNFPKAIRN